MMLRRYFSESDERLLIKQSTVMFLEISSGIYEVVKNSKGNCSNFVNADTVILALETEERVSLISNTGTWSNFKLKK